MRIESLFHTQLSDLLDGAKQLQPALNILSQVIDFPPLRLAILQYQAMSRKHEKRLEFVLSCLGVSPLGRKCKALRKIIEEILTLLETTSYGQGDGHSAALSGPPIAGFVDGRIIALLQKVNSYETASYSTLSVWAGILGYGDISQTLESSLRESRAMRCNLESLAAQNSMQLTLSKPNITPALSVSIRLATTKRQFEENKRKSQIL